MRDPGPERPCPCGSGLDYRKCCLPRERNEELRRQVVASTLEKAYRWLDRHFAPQVERAIDEGYLGGLTAYERQLLAELPEPDRRRLDANAIEWVLAEGWAESEDHILFFRDLVLGDEGPELAAVERSWLESLTASPLQLFEALEVSPGEGIWLRPADAPEEEPVWVIDEVVGEDLEPGTVFGARLLPGVPARLSGSFYPLSRRAFDEIRRDLIANQSLADGQEWEDWGDSRGSELDSSHSEVLITGWLRDRIDQWVASSSEADGADMTAAAVLDGRSQSPRDRTEAEAWYRQLYSEFADSRLPELEGLTPREAVETEGGRRRVRSILEEQERSEQEQAREQGREPADLGFVWKELGLARGEG